MSKWLLMLGAVSSAYAAEGCDSKDIFIVDSNPHYGVAVGYAALQRAMSENSALTDVTPDMPVLGGDRTVYTDNKKRSTDGGSRYCRIL